MRIVAPVRFRYNAPMSKPILNIDILTLHEESTTVKAVIDTGSFYTIIREDKVPSSATIVTRKTPLMLRAASRGSKLSATGEVSIMLTIAGKQISDIALVSPDLSQEMIVGAGTMQKWDISTINRNGHTEVTVRFRSATPLNESTSASP